ncbi:SatD family protein [Agrococcus sp. Marseille-Q4369]|uniref:SatD family protein n=1 Tax=Agrococcus sp. Marseille-Q4369 TaxID=2810513 RepID=UPI002015E85D|nr:SatD family protein [Agrococcus sp. Marseille-Q4369]
MARASAAVIADIVGSRDLADRSAAQEHVLHAFERAEVHAPAAVPAYAAVGDEFQAVYASVEHAVVATTVVGLSLPEGLELRFGIGVGEDRVVDATGTVPIRDGSAWWRAREAIDHVKQAQRSGRSRATTGFVPDGGSEEKAVRGLLLLRDHVVSGMRPRDRRIALAGLEEVPQARTAEAEGIRQSAVSQSWHRSGAAAVVEMLRQLEGARS